MADKIIKKEHTEILTPEEITFMQPERIIDFSERRIERLQNSEYHILWQQFLKSVDNIGCAALINEFRQLGNTDSAHGVYFVDIFNEDDGLPVEQLAVKTFLGKKGLLRAQDELKNYINAYECGFLTFSPPQTEGIEPILSSAKSDSDSRTLLFTSFQQGLSTFNALPSVDWRSEVGTKEHELCLDEINKVANFLANMHYREIIHGDLQLKNIAIHESGEFWLIDLEKSHTIHPKKRINSISGHTLSKKMHQKHAADDIATLFVSIGIYSGFMPNTSFNEKFEVLNAELVKTYMKALCEEFRVDMDNLEAAEGEAGIIIRQINQQIIESIKSKYDEVLHKRIARALF